MSPPISFIPRHSQPFTLEQAMQLEVDMLVAGQSSHAPHHNASTVDDASSTSTDIFQKSAGLRTP
jgi:hypothetical protein